MDTWKLTIKIQVWWLVIFFLIVEIWTKLVRSNVMISPVGLGNLIIWLLGALGSLNRCLQAGGFIPLLFLDQLIVNVLVPMADMKANKTTETVWKTPSLNVQTLERNACWYRRFWFWVWFYWQKHQVWHFLWQWKVFAYGNIFFSLVFWSASFFVLHLQSLSSRSYAWNSTKTIVEKCK